MSLADGNADQPELAGDEPPEILVVPVVMLDDLTQPSGRTTIRSDVANRAAQILLFGAEGEVHRP